MSAGKTGATLFERIKIEEDIEEREQREGLRYSPWLRYGLFIVAAFICGLCFPGDFARETPIVPGQKWTRSTIIADYSFPVLKPENQYISETREARNNTPYYFTDNSQNIAENTEMALQSAFYQFFDATKLQQDTIKFLSPQSIQYLFSLSENERKKIIEAAIYDILRFQERVYKAGYVNIPKEQIPGTFFIVRNREKEIIYDIRNAFDEKVFQIELEQYIRSINKPEERRLVHELRSKFAVPNLLFSMEATEEARTEEAAAVPRTLGLVRRGDVVVAKGETITSEIMHKIQSYNKTSILGKDKRNPFIVLGANILYSSVILVLFGMFLYYIRRDYWEDAIPLSVLLSGIALFAFITRLVMELPTNLPWQFLVFTPALSMLIAIIYDSRTAFYTTVTLALAVTAIRGNTIDVFLSVLMSGSFAIYTVRDLRSRTQIFKSIGSIFLGFLLPIAALTFALSRDISLTLYELGFSAFNAVISPLITLGILFLVERFSNVTTDLRVIEYDNLNHPLLVELSDKAPGTYQHTLTVARLAESAARAIGANAELTRVGAYFHDIGKMGKSEYFVENQINIGNKHDRLSPSKSATIIKNHVEDGIELAKEYQLPQRIIDFIPMHHGTTLISFFYSKAMKAAEEKNTTVEEEDFRYPGPKPKSKETAVLMLADSVEAASHTLDSNDKNALENLVNNIIRSRFLDGQFDECDLTMQDLAIIKDSLVRNLVGMSHHRIKYPDRKTPPLGAANVSKFSSIDKK